MSIPVEPSLLRNEVQIMPSYASSSLDLVVTMSCGLTLQICLIIALSFRCADAGGLALLMAKSHWHGALRSAHKSYTRGHTCLERDVAERENW